MMATYQELCKLIREHSIDKGIITVSKTCKKVLDEARTANPNKDKIEQINIAKELFKTNSKKYI